MRSNHDNFDEMSYWDAEIDDFGFHNLSFSIVEGGMIREIEKKFLN